MWLPRTRGDGPYSDGYYSTSSAAAPHARGWTQVPLHRIDLGAGCPARAGMDPQRAYRLHDRLWLPRTRGDGPPCPSAQGLG